MEYISVTAMCILAFITYLYLNETIKIRKMYEKSFDYEHSPKVFLREVNSKIHLDEQKRSLVYLTTIDIKNTGKSSALNFECEYSFESGSIKKEEKFEQLAYLHPEQGIKIETKFLGITLKDDNAYNMAKKLIKEDKPIVITTPQLPPVSLNVTLKYLNQNNDQIEHKYALEHLPNKNIWVYKKEKIKNI
jgi:hypothetical protein